MAKINLNTVAKDLCAIEGGVENETIGTVKAVIAALGVRLRELPTPEALAVIQAIMERAGRLTK